MQMKLTSGTLRVPIERDGVVTGELAFDPEDVGFAERFYALMEGLTQQEAAYKAALEQPEEMGARLLRLGALCRWLREQVDLVFGPGSSQAAFGEGCSLELFRQFFAGVEPIIRRGRSKKTGAYLKDSGEVME